MYNAPLIIYKSQSEIIKEIQLMALAKSQKS